MKIGTNIIIYDDQMWREFKAECTRRNTNASKELDRLIHLRLQEWKQEKQDDPMGFQVLP